ncbi:hypothetical protein RUM44_011559 [Polyplax serrata]|uniref:Uncharacterized protein n=1 Tax=Polyplax serrata TaxID=468196 RepID=A0ABR1AQC2_POLSC
MAGTGNSRDVKGTRRCTDEDANQTECPGQVRNSKCQENSRGAMKFDLTASEPLSLASVAVEEAKSKALSVDQVQILKKQLHRKNLP